MSRKELKLLVVGSRSYSMEALCHLLREGWPIVGIVSRRSEPVTSQFDRSSLSDTNPNGNIINIYANNFDNEDTVEKIQGLDPDLGICFGWASIIPETILNIPTEGFVGIHASKLPKGRGGAPVNWQIIYGQNEVGVTLFEFVPEVDHGDIIIQDKVRIEDRDNVSTVYDKVTRVSLDLLDSGLSMIESGGVKRSPQSFADATYYPSRKPQDGIIDWSMTASELWNWIRAQTHPYPGSFTFHQGQRVFMWAAEPVDMEAADCAPGEILSVKPGEGIRIGTGEGIIRVTRIQLEDGPEMWADRFAERYRIETGTVLGKPSDFPDWLYTGIRGPDGGIRYQTNGMVGDAVTIQPIAISHAESYKLKLSITLNGTIAVNDIITVKGYTTRDVSIRLPEPGSHTLRVQFSVEDRTIDERRLKLYASKKESSHKQEGHSGGSDR